jgi:hypothetical protein
MGLQFGHADPSWARGRGTGGRLWAALGAERGQGDHPR